MSELSRTRRRSEDEPTISSRQLQQTCARLLVQFESQIRAEYDKIMSQKLAGKMVWDCGILFSSQRNLF